MKFFYGWYQEERALRVRTHICNKIDWMNIEITYKEGGDQVRGIINYKRKMSKSWLLILYEWSKLKYKIILYF